MDSRSFHALGDLYRPPISHIPTNTHMWVYLTYCTGTLLAHVDKTEGSIGITTRAEAIMQEREIASAWGIKKCRAHTKAHPCRVGSVAKNKYLCKDQL